MKATILPLLVLLAAPLHAQETPPTKPEPAPAVESADTSAQHESDLSFEFTLKPTEGEPTRSTLYADHVDDDTKGSVILASQGFGPLNVEVYLGLPKDDPRRLVVTVRGSGRRIAPDKENENASADTLARTVLRYTGPGTYRIAMVNGNLLTVTIREKIAK